MNDERSDSELDKGQSSSTEGQNPSASGDIDKDFVRLVKEFIEEYLDALKEMGK